MTWRIEVTHHGDHTRAVVRQGNIGSRALLGTLTLSREDRVAFDEAIGYVARHLADRFAIYDEAKHGRLDNNLVGRHELRERLGEYLTQAFNVEDNDAFRHGSITSGGRDARDEMKDELERLRRRVAELERVRGFDAMEIVESLVIPGHGYTHHVNSLTGIEIQVYNRSYQEPAMALIVRIPAEAPGMSHAERYERAALLLMNAMRQAERGEIVGMPREPACDGNHAAPRCSDPHCWQDRPDDIIVDEYT